MDHMDEDFIIEEKVNLLQGFYSNLPDSVIRDVLNRPDIAGNVELASEALGMLMEFSETDHSSVNYVEYEPDDSAKGCWGGYFYDQYEQDDTSGDWGRHDYNAEYNPDETDGDWERDDYNVGYKPGTTSGDWGRDDYKAEYNPDETNGDWGKDDHKSNEDDYEKINSKQLEQVQGGKDREKTTSPIEGESFTKNLGTDRQKTSSSAKVEKAPWSTSKQLSDSEDEDIESWLEYTYGHGKKTSEEAIESNIVFQTTFPSIREHSKPDFPEGGKAIPTPNAGAMIEAVDSETVSRSHDPRRPVDVCEKPTEMNGGTLLGKHVPVYSQEAKEPELNLNRKEPIDSTKTDLSQRPLSPEPAQDKTFQQFPGRMLPKGPQTKSSCTAKTTDSTKHVTKETGEASIKPQPKRRNRRKQKSETIPAVKNPRSEQVSGSMSCKDPMMTHGNQEDPSPMRLFEANGILVSGLSEKTTTDALSNYMELMTGVDVERVTFLGQGRAVVDTSESPDFEKVERKINSRSLEGVQLSIERIKVCDSIFVSGLSPQVTRDTILLYFENVRRSGGGDVKDVAHCKNTNCAVVCFEDVQVIDNVVSKEHSLEGKQLSVEKYYPQISPQKITNSSSGTTSASNGSTETEKVNKQEKRDISPERPNVSTEVDVDIMQFIMSSRHYQELEERLSGLKAEIEWSPGSNTARIWKKANSGYVKKWSNSCQTAMSEFLDRFEKWSIPLDSLVAPAIKDALHRLTEELPEGKALCQQNEAKKEIEVVCLESDKEVVSKSVKEFLKIIEKEEIRKTYKKDTVRNISNEHVQLLDQIGFVEEMKSKHSELEIILDKEKRELYFEGPREQFTDSKIRYFHVMNTITEEIFTLPSVIVGNIVTNEPGRKHFEAKLAREKINAKFFKEKGNAVKIVATNSTACQKAKECLNEGIKQDRVSFQTRDAFIFESEKWMNLSKDLREEQLLEICTEKLMNSVVLHGITEALVSAKKQIEDFIDKERIRDRSQSISIGLMRFLNDHFSEKLKGIEKRLKIGHVSLQIDQAKQAVVMTGTQEGLKNCRKCIQDLFASVVEESKEYSSPGLAELLLGEKGLRNIKLIEMENKVTIELKKRVKDGVIETRQDEVDRIERDEKHMMEERKRSREDARQKSVDDQATGCIYDLCNFTTAEGLKTSWKYGNIETEMADVLVNSATSNLNNFTACGKALKRIGGQDFVEACKLHTNISVGDIVCTGGGSLKAKFVIHAVCCGWDNGQGRAEKLLRDLVNKILSTSVQLGLRSIAIPTIGTGQHRFPEAVVLRVFKEEIQRFSAANRHQKFLTEIRVIVFNATTKSTRPSVFQNVMSLIRPAVPSSRAISFGPVRASLLEGDITQQPASVGAIINVLDPNLQLASGGGVCQSILRVGGQTIQQQLDAIGRKSLGSVVTTNAGSMTNTNLILHFIPTSSNVLDLQTAIEKCLQEAKSRLLVSVSIPAIGTAAFGVPARSSAELILNAAKNFSSANHQLDVNIVVFQKNMIPDFETVIQEQSKGNIQPIQQPQSSQNSNVPSVSPQYHRKRAKTLTKGSSFKTLKTGAVKEVVVIDLFACSKQDIETSLEEVDKFIKEHIATKKIEHEKVFDVLVKHWSEVGDLARDHDVCITGSKSPSAVSIKGIIAKVSDCKDELLQLINTYVEEERKSTHVEFISKNVQWYYFQGSQSVPYDKELNAAIELAYMEDKETLEITKNGEKYEIDVSGKTEKNERSGQVGIITRKQMGDTGSDVSLPPHWDPQPPGQVVHLVSLSQLSAEYQQVLNHFTSKGGRTNQIIKIERIQNPGLYKAYLVKKESMNGADNEKQLFHGTNSNNTQSINANNFSRSFAGINGVMYGNGVYFARDASYSLRYAQRGSSGYCQMYVARVLVGRCTTGAQGMKAPPSRNDPTNPGVLYDSVVNNVHNPSIFVIFIDHQCYPEYLITFT